MAGKSELVPDAMREVKGKRKRRNHKPGAALIAAPEPYRPIVTVEMPKRYGYMPSGFIKPPTKQQLMGSK